jgi:hypothetical protein
MAVAAAYPGYPGPGAAAYPVAAAYGADWQSGFMAMPAQAQVAPPVQVPQSNPVSMAAAMYVAQGHGSLDEKAIDDQKEQAKQFLKKQAEAARDMLDQQAAEEKSKILENYEKALESTRRQLEARRDTALAQLAQALVERKAAVERACAQKQLEVEQSATALQLQVAQQEMGTRRPDADKSAAASMGVDTSTARGPSPLLPNYQSYMYR